MEASTAACALALPAGFSPDALDALSELAGVLARVRVTLNLGSSLADPSDGLAFKDVPAATDALRHKLQRARALIRTLPEIDRTAAEQQAEIAELEDRIRRQRAVLEALRDSTGGYRMEMGTLGD